MNETIDGHGAIDISVPLRDGMPIYDRNPGLKLERVLDIGSGETANVSRLTFGVHSGTHVDAPLHFINDGAGAETLPLDALIGDAWVAHLDVANQDSISAEVLATAGIPDTATRVLLRTHNGELWSQPFTRNFSRLDGSGARWLRERGARLVGTDYLSIGDADAHHELLGHGVVSVEGLDLRDVAAGAYTLICLPLKVVGSDAGPARAVLLPH